MPAMKLNLYHVVACSYKREIEYVAVAFNGLEAMQLYENHSEATMLVTKEGVSMMYNKPQILEMLVVSESEEEYVDNTIDLDSFNNTDIELAIS